MTLSPAAVASDLLDYAVKFHHARGGKDILVRDTLLVGARTLKLMSQQVKLGMASPEEGNDWCVAARVTLERIHARSH